MTDYKKQKIIEYLKSEGFKVNNSEPVETIVAHCNDEEIVIYEDGEIEISVDAGRVHGYSAIEDITIAMDHLTKAESEVRGILDGTL